MLDLIIHPGFVKTGTTFFQNNIIKLIKNSLILGKPYSKTNKIGNLLKEILYSNKKNNVNQIKKVSKLILLEVKNQKIKTLILSDEILLDSENFNINENFKKLKKLLYYLKKKIKLNITILISTRSQDKLIMSRYSYVYPALKQNYKNFDNYVVSNLEKKSNFFLNLKYYALDSKIRKIFNSKNIFLPLEFLEKNKSNYKKILKIIFKKNINYKKINFKKINTVKKNNDYYIKQSNFWHSVYLIFYKLNNNIPDNISNKIPLKNNIKSIFSKKIKFKRSDQKLLYSKKSLIKIKQFYKKDNSKFSKKYNINYL